MWVEHRTGPQGSMHRAAYLAAGRRVKGPWRTTEAEALADGQAATVDIRRGDWVDPRSASATVRQLAGQWLPTLTVRPKTLRSYRGQLENNVLPHLGDVPVGAITPSVIRGWHVQLLDDELAPSTVRTAHAVLRLILGAAVEDGRIKANPATSRACQPPTAQSREVVPLAPAQMDQLVAVTNERYQAMVAIAGYMGPRFGELAGLRRKRVDLLRRRLTITEQVTEVGSRILFGPPKTKAGVRTIVIPRSVMPIVEAHLLASAGGPEDLVFPSPTGGPLRYSNFRKRVWTAAAEAAGLPDMTFHELRHCAASLAISAGHDAKSLQKQLGIASISVVFDVYGHLLPDRAEELADRLSDVIDGARQAQLR